MYYIKNYIFKGVQKVIIHANDRKYLDDFVNIYNSANLLFQPEERSEATPEVFVPQLENDTSIIVINESGNADAFLSYHSYGKLYELTSLYVKSECQNRGLGKKLLIHFESQVPRESIVFVKALNNAPWSFNFYLKNGYSLIDYDTKEMATSFGILETPWSTILYKIIR